MSLLSDKLSQFPHRIIPTLPQIPQLKIPSTGGSVNSWVLQFTDIPIRGLFFVTQIPQFAAKKKKKKSPICDFLSQFQRFLTGQLPKFKFKILILLSRSNHLENTFHHIHDSTFHNIANQLPTIRKLDKNLPEICSHEK